MMFEVTSDSIREMRGASKREVIKRFVERQAGIHKRKRSTPELKKIYNSFRSNPRRPVREK